MSDMEQVMSGSDPLVGAPIDRVDGRLKVTGGARYSAEMPVTNPSYAVMVCSTVAVGRVKSLDTAAAERAPGVLKVLTHRNAPRVKLAKGSQLATLAISVLQDDRVRYNGQPIALVVADSLEHATHAAQLVRATYMEVADPMLEMKAGARENYPAAGGHMNAKRGDAAQGLANAATKVDASYSTPIEHHNPMEPHAVIATWEGDRLTLYDATQWVGGRRDAVADLFGIPHDNVRVVAYFVGGGFGGKALMWSHVPLAAMAAREVARPVKLVLTRRQMFGIVGARPRTEQRVQLGASPDGALTAVRHDSLSHTSRFEDFVEPCAEVTRMLYATPNSETSHSLAKLDLGAPTYQRAPGEAPGTFALEMAMDELAVSLGMDPLDLRLKNYAETDPSNGKPWSSKSLRECYRVAAERFGWSRRNATPRAMRDGNMLVGYGMASATYPTYRLPASASVRLSAEGDGTVRALVQTATHDLGTGAYTVLTQVAASALGVPTDRVRVEIGDSRLPPSPVAGGSMSTASAGNAIHEACVKARAKAMSMGQAGDSLEAAVARAPGRTLTVTHDSVPGAEGRGHSSHAFGAVFVEVHVDADLGEVRVARVAAAYAAGRILNAKMARSQLAGGIIMGIGMALHEETVIDGRTGRYLNADLGEYHVPVNADIGPLDITLVEERDDLVNPIGVKGIGEIGITGVAAAIGNAVYNATGVRVRDLPITPDRLLMPAVRA